MSHLIAAKVIADAQSSDVVGCCTNGTKRNPCFFDLFLLQWIELLSTCLVAADIFVDAQALDVGPRQARPPLRVGRPYEIQVLRHLLSDRRLVVRRGLHAQDTNSGIDHDRCFP